MKTLLILVKRNVKLFFRDKGMFFTALITPMILLMLYTTFLGNIYKDSVLAMLEEINLHSPSPILLEDSILNGYVGGQLVSSVLAVCCVTVAVCCNMLMVQDKVTGAEQDLTCSPLNPSTLALSYYIATLISTFIICFAALGVGIVYLCAVGFYMSVTDVLLIILDVVILVNFGTALSSVISFFLSSQGQISAVGTIISSGYGFICGAYMPISQFADGLRNFVCILPGTHATSLLRRHALRGVTEKMAEAGVPDTSLRLIRESVDYHIYLFEKEIPVWIMYLALVGTVMLLVGAYILLHYLKSKKIICKK